MKAFALMIGLSLGLCTLARLRLLEPTLNFWWLECVAASKSCNTSVVLHEPLVYPNHANTACDDALRMQFYTSSILAIILITVLIVMLMKVAVKKEVVDGEFIHAGLGQWVCMMEVTDWTAVSILAVQHGVSFSVGLCWEDWLQLYLLIQALPIAESIFVGTVSAYNVLQAAFPFTSARLVRFKDKIQAALLIQAAAKGGVDAAIGVPLAIWSVACTASVQCYMLSAGFGETVVGQFFTVSRARTVQYLRQDKCCDWAFEKLEAITRDGKVVYALINDTQQSLIACAIWLYWGGGFVVLSFVLSIAKVIVLPLGRLLVMWQQDEWGSLYELRAKFWALGARVAGRIMQCLPGKVCIRLQVMMRNRMAENLSLMGETAEAEEVSEGTARVCAEVLGEKHPETLTAKNILARSKCELGEREEAVTLQREVLEARTEVLGAQHPDTLLAKNDLAISLAGLGQMSENDTLRLSVSGLTPTHRKTDPECFTGDPRYDFGPGFMTKCSLCSKFTRNRGDRDTGTVYCVPCFLNRPGTQQQHARSFP